MSGTEKNAAETVEEKAFELEATVDIKDNGAASIAYSKDSFKKYIGEELQKAVEILGDKTDEYFKLVVDDSTDRAVKIYEENESVSVISVEAPIGNAARNDKLEILHVREEINNDDFEEINVKITNNISTPAVLRGAAAKLKRK